MLDFVIVGGAQAGLSMAYYLSKMGKDYVVVDKEMEVGASWLNRWDSLKLFTPSEFNNLPGMEFPAEKGYYPTKEDVAHYFKNYVAEFDIKIKLNTLIEQIRKKDDCFILKHQNGEIKSQNVVIATGPFHIPYTPSFSKKISEEVFQIHSNYYKNPGQLQEGAAMVAGAGDSGFQILDEISKTNRTTYFSGTTKVRVLPQEILGKTLWWWFTKIGFLSFSRKSWLGRKLSQSKQPIIGTDVKNILKRKNVIPVGKTQDAKGEIIITEKREIEDLKNIVWATGYRPNFSWIEGLEFSKDGYPKHNRGISNIKGLYFIGLPWLHTRGSATLGGIKKDAEYLANYIKTEEKTLA
ncbi:potassium transporter Trk [Salegentibacter salinarum]|uniref:Potassium transporter Trk n=1 Tax=Salegentibacter salinarum TaxID=447422 RepID=A0A2N0U265_9FLAO|nr:NAD(P)/FAD-dependent oxidoreductase [Salegentibacter salinarum]PKD21085.1 potassium transporter Trk [Salegentibacter salinarum]SKB75717.1 putative flavoprotein involved in K+ transport [Salegentibacter salinarum]